MAHLVLLKDVFLKMTYSLLLPVEHRPIKKIEGGENYFDLDLNLTHDLI